MPFDPEKVPGGDVARWGEECREKALAGLQRQDWRDIYDWTKSWIGWGGGAWIPDNWLLYGASALIQGQPRTAVHSLDLGTKTWLAGEADRAALAWCRGAIVMDRLKDPKTALLDFEDCQSQLPAWLTPAAIARIEACRDQATASRKRTSSVKPRPEHVGAAAMLHTVAPPVTDRHDGDQPEVWPLIEQYFTG